MTALATDFILYATQKLDENRRQIARCVGLLSDDELWQRANVHCNAVGNLVLHLTGNIRQWILGGVGGEPVTRDRPAEFSARGPCAAAEFMPQFDGVLRRAADVIGALGASDLARPRSIQGYSVSTLVAVFHVVEHLSFHTGQVVQITKELKNVDLSLFDPHGRKLDGGGASPA
ncbi:MAG: DUF1572 family protein [Phycisphaerae bacterium]